MKKCKKRRRYVIWDWNGTLLDDLGAAVNALNRMLASRGLAPTTRAYYREHFGFPVRPFYASLGVDLAHEDWDALCVDFHRFVAEERDQRLRADAPAALQCLKAAGVGQSVLSALRQDLLRRDIAAAGIAAHFEHIFGVDNLDGATKLERGRELMSVLGPDVDVCMIGDTLHDAEVARVLGARCVLYGGGHQAPARLEATGLPVTASLAEAARYVTRT